MIAWVLGVTLLAATPMQQGGSWGGWHGCWRAVDEASAGRVLCMVPGATAAEVVLNVVENGQIAERVTVRTDGQPYAVEQGGCRGMETGRWSANGRRVFVRAELDCEGVKRTSSSVLAMIAGDEWVDVQTISIHGQNAARVVHYRPTPMTGMPAEIVAAIDESRALARESARLHASAPLEIADVIEATTLLPAEGVQALIATRNSGFGINAKKLAELEAANVPGSVIDVMIAVSYPKSFVVAGNEAARRVTPAQDRAGYGYADGWLGSCYDVYRRSSRAYYSPFGRFGYYDDYCYSPYRYGWGSRYGYGYNYGYYGWNTSPVVVIVRPDEGGISRPGSVVKGAGYTRGGTSTTRTREPASYGSSGGSSTSSSGTSSSGTSSSGTTSGSSSSGRTAIPRGSGGGGS